MSAAAALRRYLSGVAPAPNGPERHIERRLREARWLATLPPDD